ncbi:hypothetical protein T07_3643 [Trichinella nelsoni]|uniref:Uncharacterized protein n=1 Tax=Trichinella nelsoni TaxID=6336 RepID=A0A0V0RNJ1_9BILA|nr:hypothetical protein T07_3643 [Trichinella nelsoni]
MHRSELSSISCFLSFPLNPTKIATSGWFIAISRQIRIDKTSFWKFLRQINAYLSNKCPLKLLCAYLNAQESRSPGTPLKRILSG